MSKSVRRKLFKLCFRLHGRIHRLVCRYERWYYTELARLMTGSRSRGLKVNARSVFNACCTFGENCNFNGMYVSGGGAVSFGNNFHSGHGCKIMTQNHNYDAGESIPYDCTYVLKDVVIGNNVWFCDDVTVLGGVRVADGAVLAVGAVVCRDVPRCAVVGGNPARVLKYRDIAHYEALEAAGKFH